MAVQLELDADLRAGWDRVKSENGVDTNAALVVGHRIGAVVFEERNLHLRIIEPAEDLTGLDPSRAQLPWTHTFRMSTSIG